MRTIFLLLVLVNLAVFAYTVLVRQQSGTGSEIPLLQISPEKIKLIRAAGGPVATKPKPPISPAAASAGAAAPSACLQWGLFAGSEVTRADAAIAQLALPQTLVQRAVADTSGYWVYIPPVKTKSELDKRVSELQALGVSDFFVVQDATPWRNAISLGIFKTEDAAKTRLASLRDKGVQSAVAERREKFLKQIAYFVHEPDEATVAKLAQLQGEFPGTQIKAVTCPSADAAKGL